MPDKTAVVCVGSSLSIKNVNAGYVFTAAQNIDHGTMMVTTFAQTAAWLDRH